MTVRSSPPTLTHRALCHEQDTNLCAEPLRWGGCLLQQLAIFTPTITNSYNVIAEKIEAQGEEVFAKGQRMS